MNDAVTAGERWAGPAASTRAYSERVTTSVEFRLADPDHRFTAVRLSQAVGLPGDRLDLRRQGDAWRCEVPRPSVLRMEYRFEVTHVDGARETVLDPANPERVPSAFGDRSVLALPGYASPAWLAGPDPGGRRHGCTVDPPSLKDTVRMQIWTPEDLDDARPAALLVVHDGPEFDALASLTRYLAAAIRAGAVPPLRAALLAPGDRDANYAANPDYAQALAGAVLPALRARWPVTRVVGLGTSLGALAWLHAHRLHPDLADGLFLQSGSFFAPDLDPQERWFPGFDAITGFVTALESGPLPGPVPPARPVPVALTCGSVEENLANNRRLATTLADQGYPVRLVEVPDAHNYTAWRDAFDPHLGDLIATVVS